MLHLLALLAALFCMVAAFVEFYAGHLLHGTLWALGVGACFWALDMIGDPEC